MTSRQRGAVIIFAVLALGRVLDRFDLPFERASQGNGIPGDSTLVPAPTGGAERRDAVPPHAPPADTADATRGRPEPVSAAPDAGTGAWPGAAPGAAGPDTLRRGRTPGGGTAITTVHVNRAAAVELQRLPGVGPVLAGRILDYRRTHGPFRDLADLRHVKGIGARTAERLSTWIRFD